MWLDTAAYLAVNLSAHDSQRNEDSSHCVNIQNTISLLNLMINNDEYTDLELDLLSIMPEMLLPGYIIVIWQITII